MRSYKDALERVQGFEVEQDEAEDLARRKRAEAGILQASDDFASALSGGAYKGADVAGPMREEAKALEQRPLARLERGELLRKAATSAREEDPSSSESKAAQAALRAIAPGVASKMGELVERMPASQIRALLPQADNYLGLDVQQRRLDEAAKLAEAKAVADAKKREEDLQLEREKLEASKANAEATRALAGENLALRRTAAMDAAAARADARAAREDAAKKVVDDKRVARFDRLSKDMEDIRPALDQIATIKGIIAKHPGDIPAVGTIDNWLPSFATSEDGIALRQTLQSLKNAYFKSNAGGNVTAGEQARIVRALDGVGTEAEMKEGLELLEKAFRLRYEARTAPIKKQDAKLSSELEEAVLPPQYRQAVPIKAPPKARPGSTIRQKSTGKRFLVGDDGTMREVGP